MKKILILLFLLNLTVIAKMKADGIETDTCIEVTATDTASVENDAYLEIEWTDNGQTDSDTYYEIFVGNCSVGRTSDTTIRIYHSEIPCITQSPCNDNTFFKEVKILIQKWSSDNVISCTHMKDEVPLATNYKKFGCPPFGFFEKTVTSEGVDISWGDCNGRISYDIEYSINGEKPTITDRITDPNESFELEEGDSLYLTVTQNCSNDALKRSSTSYVRPVTPSPVNSTSVSFGTYTTDPSWTFNGRFTEFEVTPIIIKGNTEIVLNNRKITTSLKTYSFSSSMLVLDGRSLGISGTVRCKFGIVVKNGSLSSSQVNTSIVNIK